tara:strand:- start:471 stop:830 length:360 start_codon:yes stop_codon:yes gene_type:complete
MKTVSDNLIENVDFVIKKIHRESPDYKTNTENSVAKQYGGMRPPFDNYILATSSGVVDQANQMNKILHNFDYKCTQLTNKLPAKRVGGSRRRRHSRRKKVKRTYRRKNNRRKKSRKTKR